MMIYQKMSLRIISLLENFVKLFRSCSHFPQSESKLDFLFAQSIVKVIKALETIRVSANFHKTCKPQRKAANMANNTI